MDNDTKGLHTVEDNFTDETDSAIADILDGMDPGLLSDDADSSDAETDSQQERQNTETDAGNDEADSESSQDESDDSNDNVSDDESKDSSEDDDTQDDVSDDDVLGLDDGDDPEPASKGSQERINHLTRAKRSLEEKLDAAQAQIDSLKNGLTDLRPDDLQGHPRIKELSDVKQRSEFALKRVKDFQDRFKSDDFEALEKIAGELQDMKAGSFSADRPGEMKQFLDDTSEFYRGKLDDSRVDLRALQNEVKRERDAEVVRIDAQAMKDFPFFGDDKSPQYAIAQKVLKKYQYLREMPAGSLLLGALANHIYSKKNREKKIATVQEKRTKLKPSGLPAHAKRSEGRSKREESAFALDNVTDIGADRELEDALAAMF